MHGPLLLVDNFKHTLTRLHDLLLDESDDVEVGEWQAIRNPDLPMTKTKELMNVTLQIAIPETVSGLQNLVEPNLPWAEDHFLERVGGVPVNPPPSAAWWPFAQKKHEGHVDEQEKFSHSYPERMWPKELMPHGIRYDTGDLYDVAKMLWQSPYTRQAFLPIWFPEDTGATHGERVPCTLGYHFLIRSDKLHMYYPIRSCDFRRHFKDDVYMAARLMQWMCFQLNELRTMEGGVHPGYLTMHMVSLHIFQGDVPMMEYERKHRA